MLESTIGTTIFLPSKPSGRGLLNTSSEGLTPNTSIFHHFFGVKNGIQMTLVNYET